MNHETEPGQQPGAPLGEQSSAAGREAPPAGQPRRNIALCQPYEGDCGGRERLEQPADPGAYPVEVEVTTWFSERWPMRECWQWVLERDPFARLESWYYVPKEITRVTYRTSHEPLKHLPPFNPQLGYPGSKPL